MSKVARTTPPDLMDRVCVRLVTSNGKPNGDCKVASMSLEDDRGVYAPFVKSRESCFKVMAGINVIFPVAPGSITLSIVRDWKAVVSHPTWPDGPEAEVPLTVRGVDLPDR